MSVTTSLLPLAASADTSWTIEPGAILMILILGGLYLPRWWRVRRTDGADAAPIWRLLSFLIGLISLAAALLSPIDVLAEQSFTFHMAQHMLLLDLVPIFCILGLNKILLRPATRRLQALERSLGPLMNPWVAVVLYIVAMWAWHVPAAYDAALENATVHVLEHICFLSVGFLYWWQLLSPIRSRFRGGAMGPLAYMVSTKVGVGLLGILLTFAPNPLYPYYETREGIFGLSAGVDQQIGGELMALEQTIVMGIALAYLLFRAIEQSEREQERREALEDRAEEQLS
jgi:cytochrome c oxidase assembly factor CtaG